MQQSVFDLWLERSKSCGGRMWRLRGRGHLERDCQYLGHVPVLDQNLLSHRHHPVATMHTDWGDYSSDESGESGSSSDSGANIEELSLTCDADRKTLCPCGCKRRCAFRTIYQHLRNI